MNGEQAFELLQRMGPDFLLDLREERRFQPEGDEVADFVFENARRAAYAPARIESLIVGVSDGDRFVRSEAFRKLRRLGAPAAVAMLNACADPSRRAEVPFIQAALKQMGSPALLPMMGAARAEGTIAQAVAVDVLSNIRDPLARDVLYRIAVSSKVNPSVGPLRPKRLTIHNGLIRRRSKAKYYSDATITWMAASCCQPHPPEKSRFGIGIPGRINWLGPRPLMTML